MIKSCVCLLAAFVFAMSCSTAANSQDGTLMNIVIVYSKSQKRIAHQCRADLSEAETMALNRCASWNVEDCEIVVTASNGECAAIAVADDGEFGTGLGPQQNIATSEAVENCPSIGCVVRVSRCSRKKCTDG